jgi:hypothetical protein
MHDMGHWAFRFVRWKLLLGPTLGQGARKDSGGQAGGRLTWAFHSRSRFA